MNGRATIMTLHQEGMVIETPLDLSVVLVTDGWAHIRKMVELLHAQSLRARIELILLSPDPGDIEAGLGSWSGFGSSRVIAVPSIHPLEEVRAEGVRAATGTFVFIGETHCYPHAGWADALLSAGRDHDVVVPGFDNANPAGALSWAAYIADYGTWSTARAPGAIDRWPGYNCLCRRTVLLALGDGIGHVIGRGGGFHELIGAARFEPGARMDHVNVGRPFTAWVDERYLMGFLVASDRSAEWSSWRRAAYTLAAPLILLVLLWRNRAALRWARSTRRLPLGTLLALVAGQLVRVVGEVVGYVGGVRAAPRRRMTEYEIEKTNYA